jgi:hypothetical protein
MSLCLFHSNVALTVGWQWVCGISIVTQQCGQRRCYGNGVCYIRKSCRSCPGSCVLEGKLAGCDFRSVICELYSRTDRSCTCVRILEELWTVIKSCVLNCECNKVQSWIENPEYVTVCLLLIASLQLKHVQYFILFNLLVHWDLIFLWQAILIAQSSRYHTLT